MTQAIKNAPSVAPVRWLLLDVGGVLELVDDAAWPSRFRARWAGRLGLSAAEFSERLASADLPDTGSRTGVEEEFWMRYAAALGAPSHVIDPMREDFWNEYCGQANEELLVVLASLRNSVGLAILSNSGDGAREQEERRFGFSAVFNPICYSHEMGLSKPDPRAFRRVLQLMEAEPGEVLFIDNASEHVESAERLGLRTHLHVSNESTLTAIQAAIRP